MENVTDALYMGFAVLAFVLAISVSIAAFNQVTTVTNFMIDAKDKEATYTDVHYDKGSTDRIVGAETIVPALYRMYEENFIVRFEECGDLFGVLNTKTGSFDTTNQLNLRQLQLNTQEGARDFVKELLSGEVRNDAKFNKRFRLLQGTNFYDIISENKFIETVGIYYENDLLENDTDDINKTQVRVITYTKK